MNELKNMSMYGPHMCEHTNKLIHTSIYNRNKHHKPTARPVAAKIWQAIPCRSLSQDDAFPHNRKP